MAPGGGNLAATAATAAAAVARTHTRARATGAVSRFVCRLWSGLCCVPLLNRWDASRPPAAAEAEHVWEDAAAEAPSLRESAGSGALKQQGARMRACERQVVGEEGFSAHATRTQSARGREDDPSGRSTGVGVGTCTLPGGSAVPFG